MPTNHKRLVMVTHPGTMYRLELYREQHKDCSMSAILERLVNDGLDAAGVQQVHEIVFVGQEAQKIMDMLGVEDPDEAAKKVEDILKFMTPYMDKAIGG